MGRVTTFVGGTLLVLIGSNQFTDCVTLVSIRDRPLLSVAVDPLRVSLTTPDDLPSGRSVRIVANEGDAGDDVRVVATDRSVAVFWRDAPLVIATLVRAGVVSLKLDLRPLGINIYDDGNALWIAGEQWEGNAFNSASTAIILG